MLRSSSKIKTFGALVSLMILSLICGTSVSATTTTRNTNFRVNVNEVLAVSVTTPDTWATGDAGQFLRNHIVVSATTNNPAGFTASMTTKTANTALVNTRKSEYTIPNLNDDSQVSGFPADRWGFSTEDTIASPDSAAWYSPLAAAGQSPNILITKESEGTQSQDVFFGAKASTSNASGTYANTVVISVVTGIINDPSDPTNYDPNEPSNPTTPTNPSTPSTPNTPTYNPGNNSTTYTTVVPNTNDDTTTTTTEVSYGDTRSSYADPHGVVNKTSTTVNVNEGNALATGLAVASAVAGATGFIFFIVGKRRKDEDEEEENGGEQQPPIQY